MSLPTLYVGMANPVRDADIAKALTVETIGAVAAHFNVSRTYAGTLKKLEIPGWKLTDGHASITVADIQLALQSAAKAEKQSDGGPRARREARQRLGMEA